ncbi:MAG: GNAT family N-acetyltransferase [Burkholderiales bacterium]|nr:GNAT family N-acetyltransferase [Burkholderiales bacterium]
MLETLEPRPLMPAVASPMRARAAAPSAMWSIDCPAAVPRRIHRICHELARANMGPYLAARSLIWDAAAWDERTAQRQFWLLTEHGKFAGFATTQRDRYARPSLHIGDLQLLGAARQRGGGTALLNAILTAALADGCQFVSLNVFVDNPAVRLYARFGFENICIEDDKFRMYKPLHDRAVRGPVPESSN